CRQRRCMARLVRALAASSPAVIAIDKFFGAAKCATTEPETAELRAAIADVSKSIPIVVGRVMEEDSGQYRIAPTLDFGSSPLLGRSEAASRSSARSTRRWIRTPAS